LSRVDEIATLFKRRCTRPFVEKMPTVLIFATKGAEDPTGATTPLIVARGLQETGDDVQIVFMAQGFVPVPFQ